MAKKKNKKREVPLYKLVIEHLEQEVEILEEEAHIAEKNASELRRAIDIMNREEEKRVAWRGKREEERREDEEEDG